MKEDLISFETAKLAKEKGFNKSLDWCGLSIASYDEDGKLWKNIYQGTDAPTQALLQKWLREKHKILVEVNYRNFAVKGAAGYLYVCGTKGKLYSINNYIGETMWKGFKTYEGALEIGLQQGLKLIKP